MLQTPVGKQETVVFPVRTYPGSQWYFTDMPGMNSVTALLSCWPFLIIGGEGHGGTARRGKSSSWYHKPSLHTEAQKSAPTLPLTGTYASHRWGQEGATCPQTGTETLESPSRHNQHCTRRQQCPPACRCSPTQSLFHSRSPAWCSQLLEGKSTRM